MIRGETRPVRHPKQRWLTSSDVCRVRIVEKSLAESPVKILSDNRQARYNYFLLETLEAGVQLLGTEVKSIKTGNVQLKEAYADIVGGEAWLMNAHISEYSHGNRENHTPMRRRKLLLHRREIDKLQAVIKEKGLSIVPLKLYLKNGKIKCELAVARGKKMHDKRESERNKEAQEEARQAVRRSRANWD
jgi:SsrA-binding protein